jgi:hypothetical protein
VLRCGGRLHAGERAGGSGLDYCVSYCRLSRIAPNNSGKNQCLTNQTPWLAEQTAAEEPERRLRIQHNWDKR